MHIVEVEKPIPAGHLRTDQIDVRIIQNVEVEEVIAQVAANQTKNEPRAVAIRFQTKIYFEIVHFFGIIKQVIERKFVLIVKVDAL